VCCSVLQCVAVCCSVLQCVAVCCSVLQCVAVCWACHTTPGRQSRDISIVIASSRFLKSHFATEFTMKITRELTFEKNTNR